MKHPGRDARQGRDFLRLFSSFEVDTGIEPGIASVVRCGSIFPKPEGETPEGTLREFDRDRALFVDSCLHRGPGRFVCGYFRGLGHG